MIATFNLYTVSLFLHISAAIVGLGATFALSIAFPLAVNTAFSPFGPFAVISMVVRSTRASTICEAIVRFQINS